MDKAQILSRLSAVIGANTEQFADLVEIAGLRPDVDFRNAVWRGVDFGAIDLSAFDFSGADVTGADFSRATGVGSARFAHANGLETVKWPPGFELAEQRFGASTNRVDNAPGTASPPDKVIDAPKPEPETDQADAPNPQPEADRAVNARTAAPENSPPPSAPTSSDADVAPGLRAPYREGAVPIFPVLGRGYSEDVRVLNDIGSLRLFGIDRIQGGWLPVARHKSVRRWLDKEYRIHGYEFNESDSSYSKEAAVLISEQFPEIQQIYISSAEIDDIESAVPVGLRAIISYIEVLRNMHEYIDDIGVESYIYTMNFYAEGRGDRNYAWRGASNIPRAWKERYEHFKPLSYRQAVVLIEAYKLRGVEPIPEMRSMDEKLFPSSLIEPPS